MGTSTPDELHPSMSPSSRLPIFPLPLVLLPRTVQALHIFEPRYRQLLADALAGTHEFGMVCLTPDVAEREIPHGTVGCVARIESAQALPDGRSNILVTGTSRFTLSAFVDDPAPYHVADVDAFDDVHEPEADNEALAVRVRELFVRVGNASRAIQDNEAPLPMLPDDAAGLSFAIAGHLDLELADKQRLLATRSPGERLRQLEEAIAPYVATLEQRLQVHTRARTNGHGAHG